MLAPQLRAAATLLLSPLGRERRQAELLRRLVRHAYAEVPYYRRLFDAAGLDPALVRELGDLERIPISSRGDLQPLAPEALLTRGIDPARLVTHRTSGATGQPLSVRRSWLEERCHGLVRARALRDYGVRTRSRVAVVMSQRPEDPRNHTRLVRLLERAGIRRHAVVNCLAAPRVIADQILDLVPDFVLGLPGVIERVAASFAERDRERLRVRGVVTGGEVLTPAMRERIAHGFGAPVHDTYATYEFGLIAAECSRGGGSYHVQEPVLLEVRRGEREAAPAERGEVVATDLLSYTMPMLRLRLGDVATRGACGCGQEVPAVRAIQGRMIDYFPLPDGRVLHPYQIVMVLLKAAPWVRQYRMVQERPERVVLHAVPWTTPSAADQARITEAAREALGPSVEFVLSLEEEIRPEADGKLRPSRSLVASAYDGLDWGRLE